METELPDALRAYLSGRASVAELALYVAGFDIWNTWQDGDPEIEECRRIIAAVEHEAVLVAEGASREVALQELIRSIVVDDDTTASEVVALTGDRQSEPR